MLRFVYSERVIQCCYERLSYLLLELPLIIAETTVLDDGFCVLRRYELKNFLLEAALMVANVNVKTRIT